ncbi:MAG: cytochrome c oxidase assembly protein [Salinarimonas sp.]|nr:cytochrome c oxidase assembly protein [Salinarimonas sp.]
MPRYEPYCGPAPTPDTLLLSWNFDPVLLTGLAAVTAAGVWQLRDAGSSDIGRRRGAFGLATAGTVVAFIAPLCALTVALFAARTLHHLVLLGVVAPALAMAIPCRWRSPSVSFLAVSVVLWAWHVPAIYAAAWDHVAVYWLMQVALIGTAWAFWSNVLEARAGALETLSASAAVAGLAGQMGLIGAVLTFAPQILYPEHLAHTAAFGLTPLADQQLAGLIMWVPGMLPMAVLTAILLRRGWSRGFAA